MHQDATAKVVLITGGSSGIGKEAARTLKKVGSVVYAAARRSEMMKDLENDDIRVLQLDLTDEHSIEACVKSIIRRRPRRLDPDGPHRHLSRTLPRRRPQLNLGLVRG